MGCQLSKGEISPTPVVPEQKNIPDKALTPRAEPSKQFLTWDSQATSSWDSMDEANKP